MKKTKILIPALGMLLLSTAATVSGSLAWFTANRAVTASFDDFEVTTADGNLQRKMENVQGVTISGTNYTTGQKVGAGSNKLTDASFDVASETLYTDVPNDAYTSSGDPEQPVKFTAIGELDDALADTGHDDWKVNSSSMYYAFAWKITFVYDFQADTQAMDVFYDVNGSSFTPTAGSGSVHTYNGFRLALIGTKTLLVEPFRKADGSAKTAGNADSNKRVTGTTTTAAYTSSTTIVYADTTLARAEDKGSSNSSRTDYLGQITYDETGTDGYSSTALEYTVVVWYEGCDADVINSATMDKVKAGLVFYARQAA